MTFAVPNFETIRDRYLQAVRNQNPQAAIGPDSDHYIRASAAAAVVEDLFAHQLWLSRQSFPDLADADRMEKMANQRGLTRKPAAAATGTIVINGTAGVTVPLGQQMFSPTGQRYETTAAQVIDNVTATPVRALVAGAAANNPLGLTFDAPPPGTVSASAVTATGGIDAESDAALLARLLLRLANPPQGGAKADYEQWALSVPGVARAYVFDIRRGPGTVDVVPMPVSGLPGAGLLTDVFNYINPLRPIGLGLTGFQVLAPTPVNVNVTAALTLAAGYTLGSVTAAVTAAIDAQFAKLAPGDTLIRSALVSAIVGVPGVLDVNLTVPAANVPAVVDASNLQIVFKSGQTLT